MGCRPDWIRFFNKTMSGPESYAGGGKALPIPDMPGWKGFDVQEGPIRLVDRYTVLPDGCSLGHTIVWEGEVVRLQMDYGGYYPRELTPHLREILLESYKNERCQHFRGLDGRVFHGADHRMYKYHNKPAVDENYRYRQQEAARVTKDFRFQSGHEWISTYDGWSPLGYHDYHYMTTGPAWVE